MTDTALTYLDLTYPLSASTIFWPGGEGFSLCLDCSTSSDGLFYSAGSFTCAEHCGTHVDAPYHFAAHGRTVDLLPIESLIAECFVINISDKCNLDCNYQLSSNDVIEFEHVYGQLPRGCIVLIRTGWSRFYGEGSKAYMGFHPSTDGPYDLNTSKLSFPGIGTSAAHVLVERGVAGVGLDTG